MDWDDTIAAIATAVAPGLGSVAIVRMSGPAAESIGRTLFRAPGQQVWDSHRVLYGHVVDPASGERVDEALLLLMKAPRSFTREDVVELHCHGGLIAVQRVLALVLAHGCRRAAAGEFSQRAFLNGRLDLTRAEAIGDLIAARSQRAAQLAMAGLDGGLQRRITALREQLLDQLAEMEARVDFEENLPPLDAAAVVAALTAVRQALEALVAEARQGELLRDGLRVAIVGRPNVGKSSLLNRLSRRERAIVTDTPGTTRDLLESELVLEGVPLTLLDTAGIRPTSDAVERLGIARSRAALAAADAVLLLFDLTTGWSDDDQELRDLVPEGAVLLLVGNKADGAGLATGAVAPAGPGFPLEVAISARTGEGCDVLVETLLQRCGATELQGLQVALNGRQRELAAAAAAALGRSLEAATAQLPWDFWTIDLRAAVRSLGEITGEEVSEAVLDRVFARFCIGK
ncbi:MAG: tRNA uridine-5-carboxymethylaminomethyl(34) synthesis GTPase MnmE [Cyanobium sp.]|uniref:tRNA uridine-5-carboxymethylaminomethyl(34) synthesis GTPase MnmE n=1 Tax=Synechococcus sp. CS-1333 TaxID=2848638 RepID=UPI000DBBBF37|nr:tRNA uridine-5-carboxymethylaminomethyl(34) synthesis GTPase MnmE [Synechococcus sp. CS-1333]MCT0210591.1 tRNA uridine-5-carboxymethylaminomethyl(34) synthesis GTPase MnmE [Synechococcus sp. CS-1333]PZV21092.1 MAG: tRNA uridine-5-carboxymethylaminomethyl(34) synthesis GTPase MnmE [Cyanobium sp.]